MRTKVPVDPRRMRRVLWGAQLAAVLLVTGLGWWLPGRAGVEAVPVVQLPLLILAILAIPAVVVAGRLLRFDERDSGPGIGAAGEEGEEAERRRLGRYVVVIAMAELPAILGLVYALLGGAQVHALALKVGSVLLLLVFRPSA